MTKHHYWTNASVLSMAKENDPIALITQKARALILSFLESGGEGPPVDIDELVRFRGITLVPSVDVRDARTLYLAGKPHIEFNPDQPSSRIRYSICHELMHTLFPDWKDEIRYRATHQDMRGDGWQLEMLCNIGAAELLMPIGTFPELQQEDISIDRLLELRAEYKVSIEAMLLRFAKLTKRQAAVFSCSRVPNSERYRIDYSISSPTFGQEIANGHVLGSDSVVAECTAIGFTSKGREQWQPESNALKLECVGVPPYPYQTYPRVMGIAMPLQQSPRQTNRPTLLKGNALNPRGTGKRILAFIVSDKTPRWGAGFALALRKRWQAAQDEFVEWAEHHRRDFVLGNIHRLSIERDLSAVPLIAQHGYGDSPKPRLRYAALSECLEKLAALAREERASVHMPKIGSGQARGQWPIILEMIEDALSKRGIDVTIYELPGDQPKEEAQRSLVFSVHSSTTSYSH